MSDTANPLIDPSWLAEIRRDMVRFASLQLRDDALAEDVV